MVVVAKTGFSFNHKSLRRSSASFTMWKPCFIISFPKWDNKLWVTIPLIDARLESEFPSSPIGFFQGGLVWWNLPMNCEMLQDRDIFYQTFSHHWAACRWEKKYWSFEETRRTSRDVGTLQHMIIVVLNWCVCLFVILLLQENYSIDSLFFAWYISDGRCCQGLSFSFQHCS